MTNIVPFSFEENEIRVVMIEGEPWFVGSDVAEILGYKDKDYAIRAHCKAAESYPEDSSGQIRHIKIIPERDLYRLIMKSKMPKAEVFEEWVVSEVLPSIRKTGSYTIPQQSFMIPTTLSEALQLAADQAKQLEAQKHLVEFAEHVSASVNSIPVGDMAKLCHDADIDIGRNRLFAMLRDKGVVDKNNIPYQQYINQGHFEVVEQTYTTIYGPRTSLKTMVTGKGQMWIVKKVKEWLSEEGK